MVQLNGILKSDQIKEFVKKDGTTVQKRIVYVEPQGSVFPIKVSLDDQNLKLGKIGSEVCLDVEIYPFYFENGKIKRANVNYYIPSK